jgi:hypothetical protein
VAGLSKRPSTSCVHRGSRAGAVTDNGPDQAGHSGLICDPSGTDGPHPASLPCQQPCESQPRGSTGSCHHHSRNCPGAARFCSHSLITVTANHSHVMIITRTGTPHRGNLVPEAVGTYEQSAVSMFTRTRAHGFPASLVSKTAPSRWVGVERSHNGAQFSRRHFLSACTWSYPIRTQTSHRFSS